MPTGSREWQWAHESVYWRGVVLTGVGAHYCFDWDGLPVDETCREWSACSCWPWWHWRALIGNVRHFFIRRRFDAQE